MTRNEKRCFFPRTPQSRGEFVPKLLIYYPSSFFSRTLALCYLFEQINVILSVVEGGGGVLWRVGVGELWANTVTKLGHWMILDSIEDFNSNRKLFFLCKTVFITEKLPRAIIRSAVIFFLIEQRPSDVGKIIGEWGVGGCKGRGRLLWEVGSGERFLSRSHTNLSFHPGPFHLAQLFFIRYRGVTWCY